MADINETTNEQTDLYTDEFIRQLPSKKIVEQNLPTDESENQEDKVQQKKGLGGLMKSEILAGGIQLTTKYNIFLELKANSEPLEIILELPNESTVEDCILQGILLFNQKISDQQLPFQQLSKIIEDYSLYNANKKGKIKEDLPALEGSQILKNIHLFRFILVPLKQQLIPRSSQANSHYLDFEKFEKNQQQKKDSVQKQKIQDEQIKEETCCFCFKVKNK